MKIESHTLNDIHAFRYAPDDQQAKYAIIVSHGLGGHGGIYPQPPDRIPITYRSHLMATS